MRGADDGSESLFSCVDLGTPTPMEHLLRARAGVMASTKSAGSASDFKGKWRIKEMDLWDKEAVDLVEPGFIAFNGEEGEMRFIVVRAWLDVRYGTRDGVPVAEFSWEGVDEGDQRSGRGWAMLETSGGLIGHIFFHNGDDSAFTCHPR